MTTIGVLMPTLPGREQMREQALDTFYKQVYPESWDVNILIDADPVLTLGSKINKMLERITYELPCDFVVLFDDDDLHHPTRIRRQIEPMLDDPNLTMTGTSVIVFRRHTTGEIFRYKGLSSRWIGGLAFPVSSWQKYKFQDITVGTDTIWQRNFPIETRLDLKDESLMLCGIHAHNSSTKHTVGREWMQLPDVPNTLMGL